MFGIVLGQLLGWPSVNQRLSMDKTLKDITNRLEARPVSMKPNRNGLKIGGEVVIREVGLANKWVQHADKAETNLSGLNGLNGANAKGGPLPSRPPDP